MKLATALNERSDLQTRLSQLKTRLNNNAKVQEGDTPAEQPEALMKELDGIIERLETLVAAINRTNAATVHDGRTITDLLAHRDCLSSKVKVMRSFLDAASAKVDRYSRTEIKIVSTVPVKELQAEVDRLSAQLRQVDETIQELNWTTDLL